MMAPRSVYCLFVKKSEFHENKLIIFRLGLRDFNFVLSITMNKQYVTTVNTVLLSIKNIREHQQMYQLFFNVLAMYGGSYVFRHYIAIRTERLYSLLRDVRNWGAVVKILRMGVLCLVSWCVVI
jgi:hypothetical protein